MARQHADVIEKNVRAFIKRVLLLFMTNVYRITENFLFFLHLFEAIWKTSANPGETFTQSCAEKYEVLFAPYRMTFD